MSAHLAAAGQPDPVVPAEFSLFRGGLLYSLGVRLGLVRDDGGLFRFGIFLAALTWVPLVVLSVVMGPTVQDSTVTFWKSIGTHVRLLVTIPLFFLAEDAFDSRAAQALRRMLKMNLILPQQEHVFDAAARRAIGRRDSWMIELGILALTIGMIWLGIRVDLPAGVTTWRGSADGHPSLAGWWYAMFCIPLFQFLLWRWCWHLMRWIALLWRISRLDLQLIPTHPDGAGGLAMLGVAHVDLAPLATGVCAILASSFAERILFAGVTPASVVVPLMAAIVGTTIMLMLPLTFFTHQLIETKQRALLEYGTLAADYTRAFAAKWLNADRQHDEEFLGTADVQSLADLGGSFELIRGMTIVPMVRSQIVLLAGAAALPFAPLILLAYPLDELILNSIKSVLSLP